MIKCHNQQELFDWLSKMIIGSGNFVAKQGETMEKFLCEHLSYHLDEAESFKEIQK